MKEQLDIFGGNNPLHNVRFMPVRFHETVVLDIVAEQAARLYHDVTHARYPPMAAQK
jgi:hypothetical protein